MSTIKLLVWFGDDSPLHLRASMCFTQFSKLNITEM